ncbi:MAG: DUF1622 domain-containing protein [Anaerolineae bacterium]
MSFLVLVGRGFELAGVLALVIGTVAAVVAFVQAFVRRQDRRQAYLGLREGLGRTILVGIELLVAADIIRTVAIAPTLQSVITLAIIVLIRTFLSWALEVEIEGEWPWQRVRNAQDRCRPSPPPV